MKRKECGYARLVTRCGCERWVRPRLQDGRLPDSIYVPLAPGFRGTYTSAELVPARAVHGVREFRQHENETWTYREHEEK